MKKTYLFIALAMVAAMSVSCKNNNKKAKEAAEATAEVVEAAKTILADDVLATLDELAQNFIDEFGKFSPGSLITSALTEEEILIKPDYLLEASQANEMVTKTQKWNALVILLIERPIRIAYGMPTEETDKVIARFIAELNVAIGFDDEMNLTPVEKTKKAYEIHKERGDIATFWQAMFAGNREVAYIIAQNPDLLFRNITDEQSSALYNRFHACLDAIEELAKYDDEIALVAEAFDDNMGITKEEERELFKTKESARQQYIKLKDFIIANRNNLLK